MICNNRWETKNSTHDNAPTQVGKHSRKSKLDLKQLICYQVEAKHDRNGFARMHNDPGRPPKSPRMRPICSKMGTEWFQKVFRRIQWASSDPKMTLRAPQIIQRQSKMTLRAAMMAQDAPQKCPWGTPNRWKLKNITFSKNVVFLVFFNEKWFQKCRRWWERFQKRQ